MTDHTIATAPGMTVPDVHLLQVLDAAELGGPWVLRAGTGWYLGHARTGIPAWGPLVWARPFVDLDLAIHVANDIRRTRAPWLDGPDVVPLPDMTETTVEHAPPAPDDAPLPRGAPGVNAETTGEGGALDGGPESTDGTRP